MTSETSIDGLFRHCVEHAARIAKKANGLIAVKINDSINNINDSYFRIRIWGSDIGARSTHQITFTDLLSTEDSPLSATLKDTVKGIRDSFGRIDRTLSYLSADYNSAVVIPEERERQDDLLSELGTAVAAISELVRTLVELSGPIKMEQALQKNTGPYKDLQQQVQQTRFSFQERSSAVKTTEPRTISPDPAKRDTGPFTDNVRQAPTSSGSSHPEHSNSNDENDENDDVWSKTYLLSLDGGGLRVLSGLFILQALMDAIENLELQHGSTSSYGPCIDRFSKRSTYLPCHYFDFMAGTGTGGLVALMLGRLRMSVGECLSQFKLLMYSWYRKRESKRMFAERFEVTVQGFNPMNVGSVEILFGSEPHKCKTMILSLAEHTRSEEIYIFRSYDHAPESPLDSPFVKAGLARNLGPANNIPIWQVAKVTTADPKYINPVEIGQKKFIGGGFGANNPTMEAVMEMRQLNERSAKKAALVLSIGAGKDVNTQNSGRSSTRKFLHHRNSAAKRAIDADRTHRTVDHFARDLGFRYDRLNVQTGLDGMKFDDMREDEKITIWTRAYLLRPETADEILGIATLLVENRQKRSKASKAQWERFCYDTR